MLQNQRAGVSSSRVTRALLLSLSLLGALASSGCRLSGYPPATTSLRLRGNVADAQVTIDDIPLGSLSYVMQHGVALPPGQHRITIEKAGFFPWDALVAAEEQPIFLQVTLVAVPD